MYPQGPGEDENTLGAFRNLSAIPMVGKQTNQQQHLTPTWHRLYLEALSLLVCLLASLPACQGGLLSLCSLWEEEIKRATFYFEIQEVIRLTASLEKLREAEGDAVRCGSQTWLSPPARFIFLPSLLPDCSVGAPPSFISPYLAPTLSLLTSADCRCPLANQRAGIGSSRVIKSELSAWHVSWWAQG